MKNRAEVITGINDLQGHFGDEVTPFKTKVLREDLNILCLGYMRRYVAVQRAAATAGGPECPKCEGTKTFVFDDGRIGNCFRCKGKGWISDADKKRNYGYDLHHQPAAAAEEELLDEAQAAQVDYDPDDVVF